MSYELAFIIPVYNTDAELLKQCIDSIQDIVGVKFEVVIVNDGSTEENAKEYDVLVKKYSDCFLIHKKNGGVSSARNCGIEHAKARYVYFVDADDEIEPKAFEPNIMRDSFDICFSDISVSKKGNIELWKAFSKEGAVSVADVLKRMSVDGKINGPVGKIIRRTFLEENHIFFPEDMIHAEDGVFLLRMLSCRPKMSYVATNSYFYHLSSDTGQGRMLNHTEVVVKGLKNFHDKISEMIGCFVEDENKPKILCNERKKYIKNLFNTAAELALVHRLKGNNMHIISEAAISSDESEFGKLDKVTKGRQLLMKNKCCTAIYVYGCVRKIYLILKR